MPSARRSEGRSSSTDHDATGRLGAKAPAVGRGRVRWQYTIHAEILPLQWHRRAASFLLALFASADACHRYGPVETEAFFWVLGLSLTVLGPSLAVQ